MRIGSLDRRILLQSLTETQDAMGGPVRAWTTVATLWAAKREVPGDDERFISDQRQSDRWLVFTLRWRTDVTARHRIVFENRIYDIIFIEEVGRRQGLEVGVKGSDRYETAIA